MTSRYALVLLVALAASALVARPAFGQVHDVPPLQQSGEQDCGPTAAASCLKWFQGNGYPDLATRGGSNAIGDMKGQLQTDAGTDDKGTEIHKLAEAMNKMVNEGAGGAAGPYKGQLKAKLPSSSDKAYSDFTFLDTEFSHNEDILLLFKFGDPPQYHYVTVRSITGTGNSRSVSFMDPATGATGSTTLTKNGNHFDLTYDGQSGQLDGILTMSPSHTTESTSAPVDPAHPEAGTKITYTVYFPASDPAKDLHIWVFDCDQSHYNVTGLPAGWHWKLQTVTVNGKPRCYLSIYKGDGAGNLTSGANIEVIYTGPDKVKKGQKVIVQTNGGTDSPTTGAAPAEDGTYIASVEAPIRPGRPVCVILPSPTGQLIANLSWPASLDESVTEYEVYDQGRGIRLGATPTTQITLPLAADVVYTLSAVAVGDSNLLSVDGDAITVFRDSTFAPRVLPGGVQTFSYRSPLGSWHAPFGWSITIPGAGQPGTLNVDRIYARPSPPITNAPGSPQEPYFHLASDANIFPGPIQVAVTYSPNAVIGPESALRLFNQVGNQWIDVTGGVDIPNHRILGQLQQLSSFAIVNGAGPTGVGTPAASAGLQFESIQPNPLGTHTTITYALPVPGPVRLEIYDERGRRVAKVLDESQTAGRHQAQWNGRDASGARVGAGIYWARLSQAQSSVTAKLVVVH